MANILMVDDDPELRPLMKLTLSKLGHTPTLAARGEEGLNAALTGHFDAVILDIMMPDMDGYEVARRLRAEPHTRDLPILVLTARAQAADQEAAMTAGANDFLAKPFNADELNAKLLYIIKHRGQSAAAPTPPKVSTAGVGRVLAITGWRGGVGRTTVAINLAGSLARSGRRVCLVELSPAGGQVLLHLRIRATATWLDVLPGTDKQALAHLLATHESGLMLLTAPLKPTRKTLTRDLFQNILNVLGTMFTDVVIDTAPLLDDATALALTSARHAVLVLTPEMGALHATRQALEALSDLGVSEGRQKIILNHISPEPGLPPVAVEKALGRAPDLNIPFDRAQTVALAQGAPLVFSQPTAALVTALAPFAVKL